MPVIAALNNLAMVSQARAFGRWWAAELAAMVPARFRPGAKAPCAEIHILQDRVEIVRIEDGEGVRFIDARPIEALDADAWVDMAGIVEGTRARIMLDAPDIYVTTVKLPRAARGKLRSAVSLQLDALAPIDPDLMVWNCVPGAPAPDATNAVVAMARTSRIAAITALFGGADIAVPAIHAIAPEGTILLAGGYVGGGSRETTLNRRAAMIVACLLLSIPFTTIAIAQLITALKQSSIELVERQVAPKLAAERRARDAEAVKASLRPLVSRPTITAFMAEIAARLPETDYLRSAEAGTGRRISFVVDTPKPGAVVQTLQSVHSIRDVRIDDQLPGENGHMLVSISAAAK
jgi:hypothetical protein